MRLNGKIEYHIMVQRLLMLEFILWPMPMIADIGAPKSFEYAGKIKETLQITATRLVNTVATASESAAG